MLDKTEKIINWAKSMSRWDEWDPKQMGIERMIP